MRSIFNITIFAMLLAVLMVSVGYDNALSYTAHGTIDPTATKPPVYGGTTTHGAVVAAQERAAGCATDPLPAADIAAYGKCFSNDPARQKIIQDPNLTLAASSTVVFCYVSLVDGLVADSLIVAGMNYFSVAVGAALVLFVATRGVMAATGLWMSTYRQGQFFKDLFIFTFVAWFLIDVGMFTFRTWLLAIQTDLIDFLSSALTQGYTKDFCGEPSAPEYGAGGVPNIFYYLDCAAENIFTVSKEKLLAEAATCDNPGLFIAGSAVIAVVFLSLLYAVPPLGVGLKILVLTTLFSAVSFLWRCIKTYILAFFLLTLLFGIGPLMIIMFLFEPTRPWGKKWFDACVSYAFQPCLYFALTSIVLIIIITFVTNLMFNVSNALCNVEMAEICIRPFERAGIINVCFGEVPNLKKAGTQFAINLVFDLMSIIMSLFVASKSADWVDEMSHQLSGGGADIKVASEAHGQATAIRRRSVQLGNQALGLLRRRKPNA